MTKLELLLRNCYGIAELHHEFDFSKSNTMLVYAPNGTMKTSLAKTLRYWTGESGAPRDNIYPENASVFELKIDGQEVEAPFSNLIIVDPDKSDIQGEEHISSFLASRELKERYDAIQNELNKAKKDFITALKSESQSRDCESEIVGAFSTYDNSGFFDILPALIQGLENETVRYDFRYNDVFDKKGKVQELLGKYADDLDKYFHRYDELLSSSTLFNGAEKSFGTHEARTLLNSIKDGQFFEAGHKLLLSGSEEVHNPDQLDELIAAEINRITGDEELKEIFEKIDQASNSNAETRAFKAVIEKDMSLLAELSDFEDFKRRVWLGFVSNLQSQLNELWEMYEAHRAELEVIAEQAKAESAIWTTLVNLFNSRFHVPFKVEIINQEDVILKKEIARLGFTYTSNTGEETNQDKEHLQDLILSRGEQRALYILQLLFVLEPLKYSGEDTLVVFDDLADSFDYRNKYAIISYLQDLHTQGNVRLLVLTHNFDFYRTLASRLSLHRGSAVWMAHKAHDGKCILEKGGYVGDALRELLQRLDDKVVFVCLLAFLRQMLTYTHGTKDNEEYTMLTACLHTKNGSENITVANVADVWKSNFPTVEERIDEIDYGEQKVVDLIHEQAQAICEDENPDEISLEKKVVLSTALRLTAESFMYTQLQIAPPEIGERKVFGKLVEECRGSDMFSTEQMELLDRVAVMTPESIHLNAFMYEPLIDLSLHELTALYNQLTQVSAE